MRVIEKQIIETMETKVNGRYDLSTRDVVYSTKNEKRYLLWNSRIFTLDTENQIVTFSLCGYNTTTTKSRLNALLQHYCNCGIMQKNNKLYFVNANGEKSMIDDTSTYTIKNGELVNENE